VKVKQLSEGTGKHLSVSKKFLFYSSVAFLNTLTMETPFLGTPFPCVPAAFEQWERRCHVFPLEMTAIT